MNEKYCNEINIETAEHERIVVCNGANTHIITTSTIYDDGRDVYHTTMTILDRRDGKSVCSVMQQGIEDSYYHQVFAPMYRNLCRKLGLNPKIVE